MAWMSPWWWGLGPGEWFGRLMSYYDGSLDSLWGWWLSCIVWSNEKSLFLRCHYIAIDFALIGMLNHFGSVIHGGGALWKSVSSAVADWKWSSLINHSGSLRHDHIQGCNLSVITAWKAEKSERYQSQLSVELWIFKIGWKISILEALLCRPDSSPMEK